MTQTLTVILLGLMAVVWPPKEVLYKVFSERIQERARMVQTQMAARDIKDKSVLAAMKKVPRHAFIPQSHQAEAYADHPLPIGNQQTISQPYIVAFMTQALRPKPNHRALEIGTGSGYQAAILGELVKDVYSIEIVARLGKQAGAVLKSMGYTNVHTRIGDGYRGWKEAAPFDLIIVTAAPDHVPPELVRQLKVGGRMILPVGQHHQELIVLEKTRRGVTKKSILPVRFVPMTGEAQKKQGQ